MASNKQPNNRPQPYGGVETSAKPHLIGQEQWLTATNVEFFNGAQQVARKGFRINLRPNSTDEIVLLSGVPKGYGRSTPIAMTQSQIFTIVKNSGNGRGVELTRDGNLLRFVTDGNYRRWGTTIYKNNLYFINELNPLRYTDGTQVHSLRNEELIPRGRYVENFFDHMVIGHPVINGHTYPTRVTMSHLYDFSKWAPDATKEADYFDCEEWCRSDLPIYGVTGVKKSGNLCTIYTPSAIIGMQYVGLPKVLRFDSVVEDCGCGLPWSLVTLGGRHYFFNILDFNFYCYNSEGLEAIGNSIQSWLMRQLPLTNIKKLSKMWGYVDHLYNKIVWVFESINGGGKMDAFVAYNYRNKTWGHGFCENIHSFFPGLFRTRTISELTSHVGAVGSQIADLGVTNSLYVRVYGTENLDILQDLDATLDVSNAYACPVPVLETGDITYGSLDKVKEVDSIVIHSTRVNPALGIKVEYAVRDNLEDAVTWVEIVQRWTPSLPEKRLSFPRIAGKVFRFRFTPVEEEQYTVTTLKSIVTPGFTMRVELSGEDSGGVVPPPIIKFHAFNGPVYHILQSGTGVYVCGRFTKYGTVNCKGICRINADATLDTTFKPGGVVGGGFDITYPYFAPTQLQGAADGGVFVGMSYYRLPEPNLYDLRGEVTRGDYEHLSLNGVQKPPVLKLKRDGTVDTTFSAALVNGSATVPKFMSFHMFESGNKCFYTYQRTVSCIEDVAGGTFDYGGTDFAVLECRQLNGTLIRRVFRRSGLGYSDPLVDFAEVHQVFINEATGIVVWSGQLGNQRTGGGLVLGTNTQEALGLAEAWRVFDVDVPSTFAGILSFDLGLEFVEAVNWAGYTEVGLAASKVTTMVPHIMTRGCFKGSIVASTSVVGDPIGFPGEGRWTSSETGVHKGVLHFCFNNSFDISSIIGNGLGGFTLTTTGSGRMRVFSPYSFAPAQFDATWHPGQIDETIFASLTHHEGGTLFDPAYESGAYSMNISTGAVGTRWRVENNAWRGLLYPTHLWDLRGSLVDPEDTTQHGFDPFFGSTRDFDGCDNCRVVAAQYDGSSYQATAGTDANLGVFVTGMIERFKGAVVKTAHGQLIKVRHNGTLLTTFVPPTFGPENFLLKTNIGSGADETHHNKINCCTVDPTNQVLYVGGKFKQYVVGASSPVVCGHILCLNANTGEVYV